MEIVNSKWRIEASTLLLSAMSMCKLWCYNAAFTIGSSNLAIFTIAAARHS